jgi:hypothetical protein
MPANAYALVGFFAALSAASGLLAWRLVGPPPRAAALPPVAASFGALYLVGHRLFLSVGPTVDFLGFQVALPFDVAVAVGTAAVTAFLERTAWRIARGARRPPSPERPG